LFKTGFKALVTPATHKDQQKNVRKSLYSQKRVKKLNLTDDIFLKGFETKIFKTV
jgi:hypothetical protein